MNLYLIKEYLGYWLHNLTEHSLQSPFLYDLYTGVIKPQNLLRVEFPEIENLRNKLKSDNKIIRTASFGAQSTINRQTKRRVSEIAGMGISSKKCSALYYSLGCHFEHKKIWELGTSLGINTLYLASIPDSQVFTFEGCHETLQIAEENFAMLNKQNITIIEGDLDETLSYELGKIREVDLVFFDANHRYEPTIRYFEAFLSKTNKNSLFIFDDIHWSSEMTSAWKKITSHPLCRITIDLFQSGLVFFNPDLPKQHFVLEF